jgi:hypothetical protein
MRRIVMTGLIVAGLAAPLPCSAQAPDETVVSDLVVVAPTGGPAWWKVSKGDASVWIIGLPPKTPTGLKWDQTTLKRRVKGARLMLGAYIESSGFAQRRGPPSTSDAAWGASSEFGGLSARRPQGPSGIERDIHRHWDYHTRIGVSYATHDEIYAVARNAGVKFVTPPVYRHTWSVKEVNYRNPEMKRCLDAISREIREPPEGYYRAAEYWAVGDVVNMLAASPKGLGRDCEILWRGHWDRTVAFQTELIAQALDKPGKVVAAAHIDQLVAKDGILERLRAKGFTIADPSKPLEE